MRRFLPALCVVILFGTLASADEGLWLFNAPPVEKIKARYGFAVTDTWLEHVRESSVRFNNGGSGSFVSPNGLAFTNHHIAADCLSKLSTAEHDYIKDGFYAKTRADEGKCPDLELNVLVGIEDVTAKVLGAAKPGMSSAEAGAAQRAAMSSIESQCATGGLRCDVVTLYSGGAYHLYRYKRYTDVRVVFAPEFAMASFGGDADNFEYPRYALDIAFFRVYENDKPVQVKHSFRWSTAGIKQNELVFMSGHPGSTSRLNTMAQLEFYRALQYPKQINWRETSISEMKRFAAQSPENQRITTSRINSLENGLKSLKGYYAALLDKELMARKTADEKAIRAKLVANDPTLDSAWHDIGRAMDAYRETYVRQQLIERLSGFDSTLATIARDIVRATAEREKPNATRMREYRDSALTSLEQKLFSSAPIYEALERHTLIVSFERMVKELGASDPTVKRILGERTPAEAAAYYVGGTKLKDIEFRKSLYHGGSAEVMKSTDPLIVVMRDIDATARELRKRFEDEVETVVLRDGGRIAQAQFKLNPDLYPDATFTLRLSYGAVRGYKEDGRGSVAPKGANLPYFTTMLGAFEREQKMGGKPPYELPKTWHAAKKKLNATTALNFVSTADSIGGNSGSPVINKNAELVGINFDRNMQGLGRNFYYSEDGMRHIAVDARGIVGALRNIYGAHDLVKELIGSPQSK